MDPVKLAQLIQDYGIGSIIFLFFIMIMVAKLWIEHTIKSTIDSTQKQELENLKAYNARLLNNFGLYNQSRHQAYAKLYELLLIAESHLRGRAPTLVERFTYDEFGAEDIRVLLNDLRLPTKEIDKICEQWETDRDGARREIYKWQDIDEEQKMLKAVREFHNEFLRSELYLSDAVSEKLLQIDKAICEAELYAKRWPEDSYSDGYVLPAIAENRRNRREKLESLLGTIQSLKGEMKAQMQSEMRIGQEDIF